MSENLTLWHAVEKTPLEHVKPITGKSYSGNSPKPHYLIRKATETFGPCGIGWGFTVEERIEDGAWIAEGFYEKLHIAKVRVWFKWGGERGEVEHIGGTVFSGRRKNGQAFSDEDAPKKSVTDALVKALSMIGFAGDIFMGRYDDSKYVAELKQDAAEESRQKQAPRQSDRHINEDAGQDDGPAGDDLAHQFIAECEAKIDSFSDPMALRTWWASHEFRRGCEDFGLNAEEVSLLKQKMAARGTALTARVAA